MQFMGNLKKIGSRVIVTTLWWYYVNRSFFLLKVQSANNAFEFVFALAFALAFYFLCLYREQKQRILHEIRFRWNFTNNNKTPTRIYFSVSLMICMFRVLYLVPSEQPRSTIHSTDCCWLAGSAGSSEATF